MGRRNPYAQGGLATPPPELDDDEPESGADEATDNGPPDEGGQDGEPGGGAGSPSSWSTPQVVDQGAGWVLGLLVWGWVLLPLVQGGPARVKAVWMAKFLNKAPDGSRLP